MVLVFFTRHTGGSWVETQSNCTFTKILVTCNICRKFKIHGQIKGLFAYCCFVSEIVLRSISTIKKIEFELFTQILNIGKKEKVNCVCCNTSPLRYLLD